MRIQWGCSESEESTKRGSHYQVRREGRSSGFRSERVDEIGLRGNDDKKRTQADDEGAEDGDNPMHVVLCGPAVNETAERRDWGEPLHENQTLFRPRDGSVSFLSKQLVAERGEEH
ncbi:hypothetical protein O1611_g784 [Lasiodiplodia mahajangana]|uniref:Uncharacterized protein n=1 Tax=Lasiodiplodia mahajangana TaxID=1108764 RepID=A0ACC2K056_9PEZI|nr:hypothetical protein O1611_g784 [Lasiodiplodia mahajangana]